MNPLDASGKVPAPRVWWAGTVAGFIPVVALAVILLLAPEDIGRLAMIGALPFVWMCAWSFGAAFVETAHDPKFQADYEKRHGGKS